MLKPILQNRLQNREGAVGLVLADHAGRRRAFIYICVCVLLSYLALCMVVTFNLRHMVAMVTNLLYMGADDTSVIAGRWESLILLALMMPLICSSVVIFAGPLKSQFVRGERLRSRGAFCPFGNDGGLTEKKRLVYFTTP